jgi:AraC family L-rhamnose operon regulatory protein RhaS
MPQHPAIFHDQKTTYFADTCDPLKEAARLGEVKVTAWSQAPYPGHQLPTQFLPQLRSIGAWDASHTQSWGLTPHCNEGIEFTFLARGKTAFESDGKCHHLKSGHFTITRPWQLHRVGNPHVSASRLYWLILDVDVRRPNQRWRWPDWLLFSADELDRLTKLLHHNEESVWQADPEVTRIFTKLVELVENQQPEGNETHLKLYINEFLLAVLAMLEGNKITLDKHLSTSQRVVEMFLQALPKHAAHSWDLNSMAKQCGLSRSQFSNYCRKTTNRTPIEYLNECRIRMAAQLLTDNPEMNITEVAHACGYHSSQYFATSFLALQGCSPSDFRNRTAGE